MVSLRSVRYSQIPLSSKLVSNMGGLSRLLLDKLKYLKVSFLISR